jgi:hypothetical protein
VVSDGPDTTVPARGIAEVAAELYQGDPADFIRRRDQAARSARDDEDKGLAAEIKSLRRPSAAAAAVNLLAQERGPELDRLADLGAMLRDAQERLSGDDLRALSRQRHQLVAALVKQVRQLSRQAGRPLSDAVGREVESTLEAALADAAAAEAVRSGRLIRSLEHTGLSAVDLDGAVGGGPRPSTPPRTGGRGDGPQAGPEGGPEAERRVAASKAELEQARSELADAESEHQAATARAEAARAEADQSRERLRELGAAIRETEDRLNQLEGRRQEAGADDRRLRRAADEAGRAAESAATKCQKQRNSSPRPSMLWTRC